MALKLSLSGTSGGPATRLMTQSTLSIGRGERNDWVLADPDRHLSKTHCVISEENGRYVLTDLSTNGVYINGARQPTARDSRVVLTDGDEFRLGDYSILVHEAADPPKAAPVRREGHSDDPLDIDPLDDPLGRPPDPAFSHPVQHMAVRPPEDPFDRADSAARRQPDPAADLFAGVAPVSNWAGPSQSDHADAARHAMPVHRVLPTSNPSEIDFDALIGDLSPFQPQAGPVAAPALQGQAAHPAFGDPFAGLDDLLSPAAALARPAPAPPLQPQPAQAAPVQPAPAYQELGQSAHTQSAPAQSAPAQSASLQPAARQATPAVSAAAIAPAAPPIPVPPVPGGLQAFLEGAALPALPATGDPDAVLRQAGQVFRALAEGLREVLMSRAAIKGELRVEQTLLKSQGNNALKFSLSPDDALAALLSPVRPGYMPPLAATKEAFDDIKTHELAVMAGVQTALVALLQRFDPDALDAKLAQNRLGGMMPAARKARLWENFCELYKTVASEADDDFQAVFGRTFAKAYTAQTKKE